MQKRCPGLTLAIYHKSQWISTLYTWGTVSYYRTCHYNKLLKVDRQKGQVYYFPLHHSDGRSKWFSEFGNFILSLKILYGLSRFLGQCEPFYPLFPFFSADRKWGQWVQGGEAKKKKQSPECFSSAPLHFSPLRFSPQTELERLGFNKPAATWKNNNKKPNAKQNNFVKNSLQTRPWLIISSWSARSARLN